ncbi:NAD(P)/FAD-dependent oxidoreductase [Streptomyces sp. NPDC001508]|uniref:flavin monoamine oxidase family protein n=1 Tax=Streptomyces sp. NPDC001508 TaxID=3154656 RepID=UPI00331A2E54
MTSGRRHVVVVGAGFAGLSAATELEASGIRVTVLEATDRVGGRVWSVRLPNGVVIERGAEFVAEAHESVARTAASLGLRLVPQGCEFDRRPSPVHDVPDDDQLRQAVVEVRDSILRRLRTGGSDHSLAEAFAEVGETPGGLAVRRRLATSTTVPLDQVSARWYAEAGSAKRYGAALRVQGGNERIARGLAARLRQPVVTKARVTRIERATSGGMEVECDGRPSLRADGVVLTVPVPALRDLHLPSAVSARLAGPVSRIGFGEAAKISVPLAEPGKATGMEGPSGDWWSWTRQGDDLAPEPALTAFAGGAAAIRALDVVSGPTTWIDAISATRDEPMLRDGAIRTLWGAKSSARGAYSARLVGWSAADLDIIQESHDGIVLAGEHTERAGASMNAALRSGRRAALLMTRELS